MTTDEERFETCLAAMGYLDRPDVRAQAWVLLRALDLYADRNQAYRDNWKRMGWRGILVRIRERAERLWEFWDRRDPDTDDAIDLINFSAFFVRAVEQGETDRDGEWW